jgi:hypothetical protein
VPERNPRGDQLLEQITKTRREHPEKIAEALKARRRRPLLSGEGTMFLVAADHPARGVLKVGDDPRAMADRGDLLRRLQTALERPGVDGVMATPDVVEDLALVGALDGKVVFGSMNRGGLGGSIFELDDRMTAYDAESIQSAGLDGGKLMVRVADDDTTSLDTMVAAAVAINALADRHLIAMVEVFASRRDGAKVVNVADLDPLVRAVAVVQGLGRTSAYTWLKLPVVDDLDSLMRATSLPVVMLGGDPGTNPGPTYRQWEKAMAWPQVIGLVAGRALLYPHDGNVGRAVDEAAAIISGRSKVSG